MFSRDSLNDLGSCIAAFITVDVATVAFNFGVLGGLGVEGPTGTPPATVLFIFINLAGVGGMDNEANFLFLAENCNKCWGMGGFCIFLARLA